MNKPKIKFTLLTGFLGSGKTTFLNTLLEQQKGKVNFVIENEFGSTSIDNALVKKNYNQLFELNNGCICCSLDTELIAVLEQMIMAENLPENLYIEASGVADAGMLASIFKREDIMKFFDLQSIIVIVDAENFEERVTEIPEITRQLVAADYIIINKEDMVQSSYISMIKRHISEINPFAKITSSKFGVIEKGFFDSTKNINEFNRLDFESRESKNGHGMKSIAIEVVNPFDKDKLYAALTVTMFLHYNQIYRIKGFAKIEGSDDIILVQSTGNKVSLTKHEYLEGEDPQPVLVFIGRNIERQGLERILRNLYSTVKY
ncbi:GTP-binding protein [Belliella sp. R4-6]|uniref:GTP-binding protein n=1 Tax=Belliella alkalica TaxID=1730871 RepID=A0ABS9V6U3_9BACT|nr:GTP-binding protein [Belliella alkalica]MCH7412139.1 GTP-binding protein [Belliella alkalica]